MPDSSSHDEPSNSRTPDNSVSTPDETTASLSPGSIVYSNSREASASNTQVLEDPSGFAKPPSDFDLEQAGAAFVRDYGEDRLNPADATEESVEDEIERKTVELEVARGGPVTDKEKTRIAEKIRSLREGGWLEGLKLQLVGKDAVPIKYFNRLAAEHENTIAKVAQINASADHRVNERDARLKDLEEKYAKENEELTAQIKNLRIGFGKWQMRETELQSEVQALNVKLQQEQSQTQTLNVELQQVQSQAKAKINECVAVISRLRAQQKSADKNLGTIRQYASDLYKEVQFLRQQNTNMCQREETCANEVKKLQEANDRLADTSGVNRVNKISDDHPKLMAGLEANYKAHITYLEAENKRLQDEGRRNRIELLPELEERDKTIKALETELAQVRNPSSPKQGNNENQISNIGILQARCTELQAARDMYRNNWAQGVIAGNKSLVEFWQAVENTSQEIGKLYRGVDKLGRLLGITDGVPNMPQMLDQIIAQVMAPSAPESPQTPQLTILHLRAANSNAHIKIETLKREVDRFRKAHLEYDVKPRLRVVAEEEVEKRVSVRTQAYRDHRGTLLNHIFDARAEFMAIAEDSADRDAIIAVVDRYLQASSPPSMKLADSSRL